jgi:hypothetical protein
MMNPVANGDGALNDVPFSAPSSPPRLFATRTTMAVESITGQDIFGRNYHDDEVERCAAILRMYGILGMITVAPDGKLHSGLDWLLAARVVGRETVDVYVVEAAR